MWITVLLLSVAMATCKYRSNFKIYLHLLMFYLLSICEEDIDVHGWNKEEIKAHN